MGIPQLFVVRPNLKKENTKNSIGCGKRKQILIIHKDYKRNLLQYSEMHRPFFSETTIKAHKVWPRLSLDDPGYHNKYEPMKVPQWWISIWRLKTPNPSSGSSVKTSILVFLKLTIKSNGNYNDTKWDKDQFLQSGVNLTMIQLMYSSIAGTISENNAGHTYFGQKVV